MSEEIIQVPRDLLECLVDSSPCSFDHHGGCQAHMFLEPESGETCPQQQLKNLLKNG